MDGSRKCEEIRDSREILDLYSYLYIYIYTYIYIYLPFSNNKMYNDVVFDDRLRFQLTMFEVCILIGLSRLLDTHIAYEIAI